MEVTIKKQDGTEITLTGPGAEVCVVMGALLDRKESKPETAATSGVKLTEEEDIRLTQLYHEGYRWLARDDDGRLFAYREKPFRGGNLWTLNEGRYSPVPMELFSFVSSQDDEPTAIEPIIRAMILEDAHER